MIAHLRGKLVEKQPNIITIEVGGVGYAVTVPISTYSQLGAAGEEVSLHVHTHVREDTLALFGFSSRGEKGIFQHLITVGGIGPRLAVNILSGMSADDLMAAIRSGDVARLTRIPGVGKKTGERMVLELREKLGALAPDADGTEAVSADGKTQQEVVSALLHLGCTRDGAQKAVAKAMKDGAAIEFETLFRRSLELVSR